MKKIISITQKELLSFFSSPLAYFFLAVFLAIQFYLFFFHETFFARNLVDVRPLFKWMPLVLIFLCSALTMRSFSEEFRTGNIEFLLSLPTKASAFVLGKFLACLKLVAIALILTLPLTISVSFLGDIDWGPVWGSYLASLLLASAYIAMGLLMSSLTLSQLNALFGSVLLGLFFYLLGSPYFLEMIDFQFAEFLRLISTQARFEAIERGVIDVRDVVYYLGLTFIFLSLNIFIIERKKWAKIPLKRHRYVYAVVLLFILNVFALNFILYPNNKLRFDLTEDQIYSLSPTTENFLKSLEEPLAIRGYFSAKSHPLISPLVPQIYDQLKEYVVFGEGRVHLEWIDPQSDPKIEKEINERYGIQSVPLPQVTRYQKGVINAYFHIVIEYGDQFEVLGLDELIAVKRSGVGGIEVSLKNFEYDITRSIKKVRLSFGSLEQFFAKLSRPLRFEGYISSPNNLSPELKNFYEALKKELGQIKEKAGSKFEYEIFDPTANPDLAAKIKNLYGLGPIQLAQAEGSPFYFYLILRNEEQAVLVQIPQDLDAKKLEGNFKEALERLSPGFLKTVALVTPKPDLSSMTPITPYGKGPSFRLLENQLNKNFRVIKEDLSDGLVDDQADIVLILTPRNLNELEVFALDQYLMRGGQVLIASSAFEIEDISGKTLVAQPKKTGLENWFENFGVTLKPVLVADSLSNTLVRQAIVHGQRQVQFIENYPYFVIVANQGLNQKHPMTKDLAQISLFWPSALELDKKETELTPLNADLHSKPKKQKLQKTILLQSTNQALALKNPQVDPQTLGFESDLSPQVYSFAVLVEGVFYSSFEKKPKVEEDNFAPTESGNPTPDNDSKDEPALDYVIQKSAPSAKLVVISSSEFLADKWLALSRATQNAADSFNLQFIQNTVDWMVSDPELLAIRNQTPVSRFIDPTITPAQRTQFEYLNYLMAVLGLVLLYFLWRAHYRFWFQRPTKDLVV